MHYNLNSFAAVVFVSFPHQQPTWETELQKEKKNHKRRQNKKDKRKVQQDNYKNTEEGKARETEMKRDHHRRAEQRKTLQKHRILTITKKNGNKKVRSEEEKVNQ